METKLCPKCKAIKDIEEFRLVKTTNGYGRRYVRHSYCKECTNKAARRSMKNKKIKEAMKNE